MRFNRSIWWFRGCAVLALLGVVGCYVSVKLAYQGEAFADQMFECFLCILILGSLGLLALLTWRFICEPPVTEQIASPESKEIKQKHYSLFVISCTAHAGLITVLALYGSSHGDSAGILDKIYIYLWWALFAAWPFWCVVLWRFGWRPIEILLTIFLGLLVLLPVFLLFLAGWALAHGGSLG